MSYLTKENALMDSPKTSNEWTSLSCEERIKKIENFLSKLSKDFLDFKVIEARDDGHITLKTEKKFKTSERGVMLIDLEKKLKTFDEGITVWMEPIGDKSKLRNLRGIKFKSL